MIDLIRVVVYSVERRHHVIVHCPSLLRDDVHVLVQNFVEVYHIEHMEKI